MGTIQPINWGYFLKTCERYVQCFLEVIISGQATRWVDPSKKGYTLFGRRDSNGVERQKFSFEPPVEKKTNHPTANRIHPCKSIQKIVHADRGCFSNR